MRLLRSFVYRVAMVAADLAQAVTTGFGGGNGDPAKLAERVPAPTRRSDR